MFGNCENYMSIAGHTGAILDLQWTADSSYVTLALHVTHVTHVCRQLISAATDKLAMVWDAVSGARVRRMRGHTKLINTVAATRNGDTLMATGSDDGNIKVHM